MDRDVRRDLRGVPAPLADTIARHLVAAAMLVDSDAALALEHARAAAARLPRMAAVREAVGVAAYHAGEYAAALLELRAARRIDGSPRNLPLIADSERGLGRPERAVDCLSDPGVAELDEAGRVELLIVVSGARRDMGQPDAAAVLLRDVATARTEPKPWTARLWYAYAEALLASGRPVEALRWFTATAGIDEDETDAAERAYELTVIDEDEDEDAPDTDDALADDASADDASADEVEADEVLVDEASGSADGDGGPDQDALRRLAEAVAAGQPAGQPAVDGGAEQAATAGPSEPAARAEAEVAEAKGGVAEPAEAHGPRTETADAEVEAAARDEVPAGRAVAESGVEESPGSVQSVEPVEPVEPADEPEPTVPEAVVDFSAAREASSSPVAADGGAPVPEIVFSDAPNGAAPAPGTTQE